MISPFFKVRLLFLPLGREPSLQRKKIIFHISVVCRGKKKLSAVQQWIDRARISRKNDRICQGDSEYKGEERRARNRALESMSEDLEGASAAGSVRGGAQVCAGHREKKRKAEYLFGCVTVQKVDYNASNPRYIRTKLREREGTRVYARARARVCGRGLRSQNIANSSFDRKRDVPDLPGTSDLNYSPS